MAGGNWITSLDLATVSLYGFWIFFAALIAYLHRENKREGYPLIVPGKPLMRPQGFPGVPEPKILRKLHGGEVPFPRGEDPQRPIAAVWADPTSGAPLIPTGDPMVDGVGPAAWALRAEEPALFYDDAMPAIIPLRIAPDFNVDDRDPDPRGMTVVDADGVASGTCVDIWVDRSEHIFRYLEVAVPTDAGERRIMIPVPLMKIVEQGGRRVVRVRTLLRKHFATAPTLRKPDQITLREEDMVSAYCAGGQLYAKPDRAGPLI
ncbi:MAG: photosynthetic reaction center subunit H [Acetobacteraceae bacterium]|nr:photosynthetic reaction center subunit H [Acetobacteraceae bacterium]